MPESRLLERVLRLRAFIALAVVTLVFALSSPEFLTTGNLSILVKHVAINAILAIGMTFVILSGGIDLSVGSIVGFSGMVAGLLLSRGLVLPALGIVIYPHTWFVVALSLLAGMAIGALNGLDGVAPGRRAVHRHAGLDVRGAGRRAADVRRRDVPEPRGRAEPRQHRLPVDRRRPASPRCRSRWR